jgi:hypothetical protein
MQHVESVWLDGEENSACCEQFALESVRINPVDHYNFGDVTPANGTPQTP